jgi:hypothetical protein
MNQAAQRLIRSPAGQLWYVPKDLFRFPDLKPPHKLLFLAIWNQGGARPGKQSLTTAGLADSIREDERRVREWLWGSRKTPHSLESAGLVEIILREKKGGVVLLSRDPAIVAEEHETAGRILKPDPQLLLFDFTPEFGAEIRRPFMEDKKSLSLHSPIDHRPMESMEGRGIGSETPNSAAEFRPKFGVTPEEAALHSEVARLRGNLRRNDTEQPIETPLLDVAKLFDKVTDPGRRKAALVQEITSRVDDPGMDPSIPGRAADLVVCGKVPYAELHKAVRTIEDIRRAKKRGTGSGFSTSPGALFLSMVRKWPGWETGGSS